MAHTTAIKFAQITLARARPAKGGGWGGIRTHGTLSRTPVFKTGTFNHSVTHPAEIAINEPEPDRKVARANKPN